MKTKAFFSNKKHPKQAAEEIIEKVNSALDFDPDLVLFYATLKYNGHYQEMLNIFKKRFDGVPQIGASVDGMMFPHDMRTDGAVLVVGEDKDARIEVKSANEKGAIKSAEKLAKQIKCEKGVVILHFPLIHVPDLKKSTEFYTKGKYYSYKASKGDEETKKKMAKKFSDFCEKSKIFYLPPTILEIFAAQLNYKLPIVGMNLMHTQVKLNSPSIFSNFKDIEAGIAALTIEKDDVEVIYDDIFPEKGNTIEETKEIIKENFKVVKEFDVLFEKNILISLDGKPPVQAVKDVTGTYEKDENELMENLDKGKFKVQVPYILMFFNEKLKSMQTLGIDSYFPFDLFPFFFDIDQFSKKAFLSHEPIFLKPENYISGLQKLKMVNHENHVFFCIDVGSISAFGDKVISFKDKVAKIASDNYFGIISESPSIYLPKNMKNKNYMTESKENIFFTSGGGNIFMSI